MSLRSRFRMFIVAAVAGLTLLGANLRPASAADSDGGFDTLDAACKDLAAEIDKALTAEKIQGSIILQSFTNGGNLPNANIGLLLKKAFEEKKYKVQDKGGAPAFVKGTLFVNKTSLVIETDLHRTGEGRLQTWKHRVNNLETAAQGSTFDITAKPESRVKPAETTTPATASTTGTPATTGAAKTNATTDAAPLTPKEKAAEAIRQDAVTPSVAIAGEGTVARPTPASRFGFSVLVKKEGKLVPLPITNVDGVAIVQLAMDQEFQLSIVNDSKADVGASVSIDGVNMFIFSEVPAYKDLGKLWIGTEGGLIDGWYHNDQRSRAFQMGKYDESVASSLGLTEGVGSITVTFYGDPTGTGSQPRTAVRPETGIKAGRVIEKAAGGADNYVAKQGHFGELIAAVTVRYQKSDHPTDLPPGAK